MNSRHRPALHRCLVAVAAALLLSGCLKTGGASGSFNGGYASASASSFHQVALRDGGQTVTLNGEVTLGSAKELAKLIKENPEVREVQLTSNGGLVKPALTVANTIQLRRATVFVPTTCISACTLLFLGGETRYLAPNAKLGFHRAFSNRGGPETASTRLTNEQIRQRLLERGISADFVARVLSTPGSEVWFPTHEELLAAGVIHAVLAEGQLKH